MDNKIVAQVAKSLSNLSSNAEKLSKEASILSQKVTQITTGQSEAISQSAHGAVDPLIFAITIFVLSCFVGYYVIWKVTPALHTPLMSVTNAISGIIIVGAMIASGPALVDASKIIGFFAVLIASINIFGGFVVTQRMLAMFRKN